MKIRFQGTEKTTLDHNELPLSPYRKKKTEKPVANGICFTPPEIVDLFTIIDTFVSFVS